MDRDEFYKRFWDDLKQASQGTHYQSGEDYFNANFGSSEWFARAQNPYSRRQGRRPQFNINRNMGLTVTENVSFEPFKAFQKRSPQDGHVEEMMVSSFLFEMYVQHNTLFWLIVHNISMFVILYNRKQYHEIFKLLKQNASR